MRKRCQVEVCQEMEVCAMELNPGTFTVHECGTDEIANEEVEDSQVFKPRAPILFDSNSPEDTHILLSNQNTTDFIDSNAAHDLEFETSINCTSENRGSFVEDAPMIISNQNATDYSDLNAAHDLQFETSKTCTTRNFAEDAPMIISNQNTTDYIDSYSEPQLQFETSITSADGHVVSFLEDFRVIISHQNTTNSTDSNRTLNFQCENSVTCTKEALDNSSKNGHEEDAAKSCINAFLVTDVDEDEDKEVETFDLTRLDLEIGSEISPLVEHTDINHTLPLGSFVPIQEGKETLLSDDSSSDSDSDTDSSSLSSSPTSSSVASVSLTSLLLDADEDDDLIGKDGKGFPVTPKEVLQLDLLPPVEDLTIHLPEEVEVKPFGVVSSIFDQLVIIESYYNQPVLSEGSVVFKEDKSPVGEIFEIFGPIPRPSYLVRFNSSEHIEAHGIKVADIMCYAPAATEYTDFLLTEKLKQQKGSDASWANDIEPPPDVLDYSDDEKEKIAKQQRKALQEERKKLSNEKNEHGNPQVTEKRCPQQSSSPSQAPSDRPGFLKKRFPHKSQREFRPPRNSYDSQQYSGSQWTPQEKHLTKMWHQRPQSFPRSRNGIPMTQEHNGFPAQIYNPSCEITWQYPFPPPPMNSNVSWSEQNLATSQYSLMLPPPPPPPPLPFHSYPTENMYNFPYSSMPPPPPPHPPFSPISQFSTMPPTLPLPPDSYLHNPSFPSMPPPFTSMPPPLSPHQPPPLSSDHPLFLSLFQPPPPPSSPPPGV